MGVAKEIFAAPVTKVLEILDMQPIAGMPLAPPHLLGMTDVRGKSVPVVDLARCLGMPHTADTEDTRIVVLNVLSNGAASTMGVRTDKVVEVTTLDHEALEPPPLESSSTVQGIAGIGRRHGQFVTVLDVDRLFGS